MTDSTDRTIRRAVSTLLMGLVAAGGTGAVGSPAVPPAEADVVLVVDTSESMSEPGMDPERTSLLVARLFADIVPGELAVVRLHDFTTDAEALGARPTGRSLPCGDDRSRTCGEVELPDDWEDRARKRRVGALERPRRGDPGFKESLASHLLPVEIHSQFVVPFRAAQGVLESHGDEPDRMRTVVWLSDGRPDDPSEMQRVVGELRDSGARVEAILFGAGDPRIAREAGLEVRQAVTPRALMAAFTDVFRGIVEAPYGIDGRVADQPTFEIEPNVDEAWVVIYGDATLRSATLEGPDGPVAADHGEDRHPPAGAYRVAYLPSPTAGPWTIRTSGGGPDTVYSVIQRSALAPVLLAPESATTGAPVRIVAGIRSARTGPLVTAPQVLDEAALTLETGGRTLALRDDGTDGDEVAGDGRFSTLTRFDESGEAPLTLRLETTLVRRTVEATVDVSGSFVYRGGPVSIDLGSLRSGETACRPLRFDAEHEGTVPVDLRFEGDLPTGHRIEVRGEGLAGVLSPGGETADLAPGDRLEVCLITGAGAPSSRGPGEPFILAMAGRQQAGHGVPLALSWEVSALSFWGRWWKLILALLGIVLAAVVVAGYILPHRFSGALALTFVPDRRDLDDQLPQPIRQWKGIGAGFYRSAHAYLHADYRVSGSHRGALAALQAESRSARVTPGKGSPLYRETVDGDWEPVPSAGRPIRPGDVYRVGDGGPYFRIGSRR